MKVYIVDAIMGAGKTTAAINYMNEHTDKRYIYITPFLSEIERIKKSTNTKFYDPKAKPTKLESIKRLIQRRKNIISSHALFQNFDQEAIDLCRNNDYVLILDEVMDVVNPYEMSKYDAKVLLDEYVDVDNDILVWKEDKDDYSGKFITEKRLCDLKALACYNNQILMWLFPIQAFNAFNEIYILTYMFDAQMQRYYYDYYGLDYSYLYIKDYHFCEDSTEYKIDYDFNELIEFEESEKLNAIGESEYDLAKAWYIRNSNNNLMKRLKDNIYNFFRNKHNLQSKDVIWTTFKDYKKKLSPQSYARGYLPCNTRAINDKQDTVAVAYPINRYMNPVIHNFFVQRGVDVDEDGYALSEMLQFIWRSGIRNGKKIYVYIPSKRMRGLLKNWIKNLK